jgi:hypothetical protein
LWHCWKDVELNFFIFTKARNFMECCKKPGDLGASLLDAQNEIELSPSEIASKDSKPSAMGCLRGIGSFVWNNKVNILGTALITAGTAIASYQVPAVNDGLTSQVVQPFYLNGTSPTEGAHSGMASVIGPFVVGGVMAFTGVTCMAINKFCNNLTAAHDKNNAEKVALNQEQEQQRGKELAGDLRVIGKDPIDNNHIA